MLEEQVSEMIYQDNQFHMMLENQIRLDEHKWSKDNQYDRFSVQQGIKQFYDVITAECHYTDVTYEFILWTNFIEQMNPLVEFLLTNHILIGMMELIYLYIDSVSDEIRNESRW